MKFPLISKNAVPFYPKEEICPICRQDRKNLKGNFLVINGGALKKTGLQAYSPSPDLAGFLNLTYHAGDKGRVLGSVLNIVDGAPGGQFDIYCCSFSCLRTFLAKAVDELEKKLEVKK